MLVAHRLTVVAEPQCHDLTVDRSLAAPDGWGSSLHLHGTLCLHHHDDHDSKVLPWCCHTHCHDWLVVPRLLPQNPDRKGQGPNVPSAGPEPEYSDEQREEFGDRAWIGVEDRSLLDVAGTELLLVGAKDKPIETGGDMKHTTPNCTGPSCRSLCGICCW
jgi:hypothetical protein